MLLNTTSKSISKVLLHVEKCKWGLFTVYIRFIRKKCVIDVFPNVIRKNVGRQTAARVHEQKA